MAQVPRTSKSQRIIELAKNLENMEVIGDDTTTECSDCPEGKGKKASFPRTNERAEKTGETVCVDLSGKIACLSLDGYNYYMIAEDEFTEFCYVYCLKNKATVHNKLATLISEFEQDSVNQIKKIYTDQGSEFINKSTEILFQMEGIIHETSPVYTPQQNGVIEREVESITAMARTMLCASDLPKELWPEAIQAATHLRNRLSTKRSSITPYERFTGKKPRVEGIIQFGKEVHVLKLETHLTKFEARTQPGWIVGYTKRRRNYLVYNKIENKVIETRGV